VFVPSIGGGFVNIDDPSYVQRNPLVLGGLSPTGISHALTDVVFHNWAPLTILSLQLDTTLFGTAPWGYHLTNVLIHSATAGVLYVALFRMTGAAGLSAAATILFALHPLRVESVAWIAERKDVLSVFFVAVALVAYERYCRRPSPGRYGAVAVAMVASLLAKATAVTLPVLLLVLDVWPIGRGRVPGFGPQKNERGEGFHHAPLPWTRLVAEKLPLFGLAVLFTGITLATNAGVLRTDEKLDLWRIRAPNALIAIGAYLFETAAPVRLSPVHELSGDGRIELLPLLAAAGAIAVVTALAFRLQQTVPACAAGLAWFFISLLPVVGIVGQLGFASRADRFTYIPHIGLMIAIVWLAGWLCDLWKIGKVPRIAAVCITAATCIFLDWRQIAIWHDSFTLWNHVLAQEPQSALAHMCLGEEWYDRDQHGRAEREFRVSLALKDTARARDWLGIVLAAQGRLEEAYSEHAAATRLDNGFWEAHNNAGIALARMGRMKEALGRFEQAARLAPSDQEVRGNVLRAKAELR
jgi:hypothetical protein